MYTYYTTVEQLRLVHYTQPRAYARQPARRTQTCQQQHDPGPDNELPAPHTSHLDIPGESEILFVSCCAVALCFAFSSPRLSSPLDRTSEPNPVKPSFLGKRTTGTGRP